VEVSCRPLQRTLGLSRWLWTWPVSFRDWFDPDAVVILTEILSVGKHENGPVIRKHGRLSQNLENRPRRPATTVAAVYAQTPPRLPLVDVCSLVTLDP
jgi:hypothetical protein